MFRGTTRAQIAGLARVAAERQVPAGGVILRRGERAPGLMVVRQGLVKISLKGDSERVLRILEGIVHGYAFTVSGLEPFLHDKSMRNDVEAPLLEITHFVLGLADHDLDDGVFHPLRLTAHSLDRLPKALAVIWI